MAETCTTKPDLWDYDNPEPLLDAIRTAIRAELLRHKRLGNPIAVLRDGEVVLVPPEEILAEDPSSGQSGKPG